MDTIIRAIERQGIGKVLAALCDKIAAQAQTEEDSEKVSGLEAMAECLEEAIDNWNGISHL